MLKTTLKANKLFFLWFLKYFPIYHSTEVLWQTNNLKIFFYSLMNQILKQNTSSDLSISNYSNSNNSDLGSQSNTPTPFQRKQQKKKRFNQGGNIVYIFEKDSSSYSKKDIRGVAYIWGQNNEGQLGCIIHQRQD